jgi:hypothetical protein
MKTNSQPVLPEELNAFLGTAKSAYGEEVAKLCEARFREDARTQACPWTTLHEVIAGQTAEAQVRLRKVAAMHCSS